MGQVHQEENQPQGGEQTPRIHIITTERTESRNGQIHFSEYFKERVSRQKISLDVNNSNNTVNQLNPTDIYRTLHPTTVEYTFFSKHVELDQH